MTRKVVEDTESDKARIWAEVSVTVNLGDYESVKVTLGGSRSCDDTPQARRTTSKELHDECEKAVVRKAEHVKRIWSDK